jgi:hypothetical protein
MTGLLRHHRQRDLLQPVPLVRPIPRVRSESNPSRPKRGGVASRGWARNIDVTYRASMATPNLRAVRCPSVACSPTWTVWIQSTPQPGQYLRATLQAYLVLAEHDRQLTRLVEALPSSPEGGSATDLRGVNMSRDVGPCTNGSPATPWSDHDFFISSSSCQCSGNVSSPLP